MMFDGINLIAVAAAAIVSFLFGALWYGILGKAWMNAAGLTKEQTRPNPVVFATAFFCQIIMAFVFAGVIYHTGGADIRNGIMEWTDVRAAPTVIDVRNCVLREEG